MSEKMDIESSRSEQMEEVEELNNQNNSGMTTEEVREHLKGLKTDDGRIRYLTTILQKEGLLMPETKESINDLLKEYLTPATQEIRVVGKDKKKKLIEVAKMTSRYGKEDFEGDGGGGDGEACSHYIHAVNSYIKAGEIDKAKKAIRSIIKITKTTTNKYPSIKYGRELIDIWERLGEPNEIVNYFSDGVSLDQAEYAAKRLEKTGYILQAKKLRNRLEEGEDSK